MADLTDILSINGGPLAGLKNKFINGNFDIWQRGTSFTVAAYWADRWRGSLGSGGAATISRQAFTIGQTDVPGNPNFYFRHNRTSAASTFGEVAEQRLEGVETLAGETVTWSFWAKSGATKTVIVDFVQTFGTGGSPSSNVDGANQNVNLTTSWQKFVFQFDLPSVSGKTLGTNGNDAVRFRLAEASSFTTFTIDVARSQLEVGTVATEFEERPIGMELALCERYFQKSYTIDVDPGTASFLGAHNCMCNGTAHREQIALRTRMRDLPTVTLYNPNAAATTGSWRQTTGTPANRTVAANNIGDVMFRVDITSSVNDTLVEGHWTVESEL